MEVNIEDSWKRRLQPEFDKPYFYNLTNFVKEEYSKQVNKTYDLSSWEIYLSRI